MLIFSSKWQWLLWLVVPVNMILTRLQSLSIREDCPCCLYALPSRRRCWWLSSSISITFRGSAFYNCKDQRSLLIWSIILVRCEISSYLTYTYSFTAFLTLHIFLYCTVFTLRRTGTYLILLTCTVLFLPYR